jgi:hypothetical protein
MSAQVDPRCYVYQHIIVHHAQPLASPASACINSALLCLAAHLWCLPYSLGQPLAQQQQQQQQQVKLAAASRLHARAAWLARQLPRSTCWEKLRGGRCSRSCRGASSPRDMGELAAAARNQAETSDPCMQSCACMAIGCGSMLLGATGWNVQGALIMSCFSALLVVDVAQRLRAEGQEMQQELQRSM